MKKDAEFFNIHAVSPEIIIRITTDPSGCICCRTFSDDTSRVSWSAGECCADQSFETAFCCVGDHYPPVSPMNQKRHIFTVLLAVVFLRPETGLN
ncbi:hypothetical protein [Methanocalculus sp.]|uniref:hypothetical protein n=1 Tax=Methanocalculus sp. TaxID=2004547 RepID=UPI0027270549|nr:hypothetical protein [Methanocalculus sp.]MDO8841557.1 hypothetical protein [Methanocalculus sp.]